MYFAEGISTLFASHPPLESESAAIDPQWNGKFPPALPADAVAGLSGADVSGLVEAGTAGRPGRITVSQCPSRWCGMLSTRSLIPTELHRTYVQELIAGMPAEVVDAAHEPYGARALIFATLLDENADVRTAQLQALQKATEPTRL